MQIDIKRFIRYAGMLSLALILLPALAMAEEEPEDSKNLDELLELTIEELINLEIPAVAVMTVGPGQLAPHVPEEMLELSIEELINIEITTGLKGAHRASLGLRHGTASAASLGLVPNAGASLSNFMSTP